MSSTLYQRLCVPIKNHLADARKKSLKLEKDTREKCQLMWDGLNDYYDHDIDMDAAILRADKECKKLIHQTNMTINDIMQDAIAQRESHIWDVVDKNSKY